MSIRLNTAIILSFFLHLIFINFVKYGNPNYQIKSDLFNNKIALNFSFSEKKQLNNAKYSKNHLEKNSILKKTNKISKNIDNKSKIIPNITDYQLVGKKITPNYPKRSLKLGQEGVVYLKILVSDNGLPEEIIFTQKSQYNLLNEEALDAVSRWKFKPIMINGFKSKIWVSVPIEFKIS